MIKYTESHEWIQVDGKAGIVGITDFAQKELGDIVYVELPQVGKTIKLGQEAAVLESTKAAADVYAPVSGKITAVNDALKNAPELVNQSADSDGWLFKIELSEPTELDGLMEKEAYLQLVKRG